MADREAWLGLSVEEALQPELPICDPHHHLWEYPDSRYLAEEFLSDIGGGHRVVSTVFVECLQKYRTGGPEHLRPVGETEFVERLAGSLPAGSPRVAAGIVGFADLALGSAVREVLEAHLGASPRFRGVRHASAWHPSERIHDAHTRPPEGLLQQRTFREGFACLGDYGLSFDAWLYHSQLDELADLARAFPDTTIVLDHMAGPAGIGPYADRREEVFEEWRASLARLAECGNVFLKVGGRAMTLAGFGWHKREAPPGSPEIAAAIGPYCRAGIDLFGPGRSMFESNFPMDRASCTYTALWNAFKLLSQGYSETERAELFHGTAQRVYRLGRQAGDRPGPP